MRDIDKPGGGRFRDNRRSTMSVGPMTVDRRRTGHPPRARQGTPADPGGPSIAA
jgi:hypothetical protein